jgi:hypothetical protein
MPPFASPCCTKLEELRAKLPSLQTRYGSHVKDVEAVEELLQSCDVTEWV